MSLSHGNPITRLSMPDLSSNLDMGTHQGDSNYMQNELYSCSGPRWKGRAHKTSHVPGSEAQGQIEFKHKGFGFYKISRMDLYKLIFSLLSIFKASSRNI